MEPVKTAVRDSHVYSVMFDGATDCSVSETEIVYCRYLKDGYPEESIIGLEDIEHAHADGVYDAVSRSMERHVYGQIIIVSGLWGNAINKETTNNTSHYSQPG